MEKRLPEGWEWKRLGDVATVGAGNSAPQGEQYFTDGAYPFVRTKDAGREKATICLVNTTDKVNNFAVKECKLKLLPAKTLLVPKSGASTFLNHRTLLGEPSYVSSHLATVIAGNDLLPEYLYFWSLTIDAKQLTHDINYPSLRLSELESAKIPTPPLETQRKIVAILEKADETKRLRMQADELTNQLLQSVFLEMFGDPAKNPKGWEIKELKEMGFVKTGNTPPRKNPEYYGNYIEWIKSDNINTPYTYLTKSEEMLSEEGVKVGRTAPKNSVLVTCIAGSISCIGNVAIADRDVAFNQQINAIIPKEHLNDFFLYYLILSSKSCIQNSSTQGMKGMISKSAFESLRFICPPSYLQDKFRKYAEEVEKLKNYQKHSQQEIDNLFNALMQKAFKGELAP
ncbi:MAG: restriction endonuclease subunit S [Candidatus Methanospirareceae archaeon]